MNYLVTLSGAEYDAPTEKILRDAPGFGHCDVMVYDDKWFIYHPFWTVPGNQWLANHSHRRGLYWYVWKPLVIIETLKTLGRNDSVVMFNDADSVPIKPFWHLFDECRRNDHGILLFRASGHNNRQWCKRDTFVAMCQDRPDYWNMQAGVARFCLFRKGSWAAQQFLMEWLTYAVNPHCNTFDESCIMPELDGFQQHRCEQAILTLLAGKYGIELLPELDYEQSLFSQENPRPVESRQETAPIKGSRWRNV